MQRYKVVIEKVGTVMVSGLVEDPNGPLCKWDDVVERFEGPVRIPQTMRFSLKFKALNNFGIEAPGQMRTISLPPLAVGWTPIFCWVVDSNKILWIQTGDKDGVPILESPALTLERFDAGAMPRILRLVGRL